ncbi:MAG: hypothetical protein FDW93_07205 [Bergeyella sp.]|nr:hypothetical protein [Bergeyella sp.]
MNIPMSGATGLMGSLLKEKTGKKWSLRKNAYKEKCFRFPLFFWDYKKEVIDPEALENMEAIIHLAGAPVNKRWTPAL